MPVAFLSPLTSLAGHQTIMHAVPLTMLPRTGTLRFYTTLRTYRAPVGSPTWHNCTENIPVKADNLSWCNARICTTR